MFLKHGSRLLIGAIATAIAGTAMANTTLEATTTGDLFLNIVDSSKDTSYLFDTGVSQAAFNSNGSYSFSLAGDANLTGFLNGTDTYYYSVISATKNTTAIIDATGNIAPNGMTTFLDTQAQASISQFLSNANTQTSASTTSVVLPTGTLPTGTYWGASYEQSVSTKLFHNPAVPYSDQAALNTALPFYNITGSTANTFAHTWDFSSTTDKLTYNPVPLPTPVLLLLSGLGLMGAVSRRSKSAV